MEYNTESLIKRFKQFRYLLIVDVEHTCTADNSIPPNEREIIEIGAVLLLTKSLRVIDEFEALVRPIQHPLLSEFCTDLTGIRQEDVDIADNFGVVYEKFEIWLNRYDEYLFSSWGGYDEVQLRMDCEHHNIKPINVTGVLNLKKAFARVQKIKPQVGMKRALRLTNIASDGLHHRALDDARNIAKLVPYALGLKSIS